MTARLGTWCSKTDPRLGDALEAYMDRLEAAHYDGIGEFFPVAEIGPQGLNPPLADWELQLVKRMGYGAYTRACVRAGAYLTDPEQDDPEPPPVRYECCWKCEGIGRYKGADCSVCKGLGLVKGGHSA